MDIIVNLNKPKDITSQDGVTKVKKTLRAKKAGHAGTLDPMATGVLLVCVNKATRLASFFASLDKEYRAVMKLGTSTDTQDAYGKVIDTCNDISAGREQVEAVLKYLGVDIRHPRQTYRGPTIRRDPDGSWTDPWGVRRRSIPHEGGAYEEIIEYPLAGLDNPNDLAEYPWPRPEWWDATALRDEIQRLDMDTPHAIALEEFGDPGTSPKPENRSNHRIE